MEVQYHLRTHREEIQMRHQVENPGPHQTRGHGPERSAQGEIHGLPGLATSSDEDHHHRDHRHGVDDSRYWHNPADERRARQLSKEVNNAWSHVRRDRIVLRHISATVSGRNAKKMPNGGHTVAIGPPHTHMPDSLTTARGGGTVVRTPGLGSSEEREVPPAASVVVTR